MSSVPRHLLESFAEPWYKSMADPASSQQATLKTLLEGYGKTEYGRRFGAESVSDPEGFRRSFPVVAYSGLRDYLARVQGGEDSALLPEPIVRWVMTRGTTGEPKSIPATQTHLSLILAAGARAIVNFALKKQPKVLERPVLNLNFPSEVGMVDTGSGKGPVGYSSGTYARLNPGLGPAELVPRQEEVDELGPGIAKADWERRFELVYQRAKGSDVGSTMGVTPVILAFARFLRRRHGTRPSDLWRPDALFCTSVAKIQTRYAPELRHHYGGVFVVEMYTATEGVFAQQLDDRPYVSPNYDCYFFEASTRRGTKMLHDMRPGEWGRVIVSTPLFPRYDIGDLVEAQGKGYFRVLGRARLNVAAEHVLFNLITGRLP
jgi:hypothetical protein